MRIKTSFLAILTAFALTAWLAAPGAAGDNPYLMDDNDWISLTGTVTETSPERFRLDYGTGYITVEMDDWDVYDESMWMNNGEKVTVYGRIDDSFFEKRTIEAGSVFVFDRHMYYYANSADEEGDFDAYTLSFVYPHTQEGDWLTLTGTIRDIDDREFTLVTGLMEVTVDTDEMAYDPFDDEGYQKLKDGDRVSIWGQVEDGLFEERHLSAQTITTLTGSEASSS